MSDGGIKLSDGVYTKAPFPADRKSIAGIGHIFESKDDIPTPYRYAFMKVTDSTTGAVYELQPDLVTWTLWGSLPSWVKQVQGDVQISAFGGQLDWTRIDNAPEPGEVEDPIFSAISVDHTEDANVTGAYPNLTIEVPKGVPGGKGNIGDPGLAATIHVGYVTEVAYGEDLKIINGGTENAAVFNFEIPAGPTGEAATISVVADVITLAPGEDATVENIGTTSEAVFEFSIPQGQTGVGIPGGGEVDQILTKLSSNNYDFIWKDPQNVVEDPTADGIYFYKKDGLNFSWLSANYVDTHMSEVNPHSTTIESLSDTDVTTPAAGDQLVYNSVDGTWDNKPINYTPVVDYVDFNSNLVSTPTFKEGRVYYDGTDKTLAFYSEEAEATMQIGREMWMRVYNNSGADILNGKATTVTGTSTSGVPYIGLAQADIKESALNYIGLATHTIENATFGYVTTRGFVHDINTSHLSNGSLIYLSTVPGEATTERPPSPNFEVRIGGVARQSISEGVLYSEPLVLGNIHSTTRFMNGSILEAHHVHTASNGSTVTLTLDHTDEVSDLSILFDEVFKVFDAPSTINLVPGTDPTPIYNFVFIPRSTNILTVNTTGFPTTEQFIPVAQVLCQSAISAQSDGLYKVHAWTDHLGDSTGQGHLSHINAWIRHNHAKWVSGNVLTTSPLEDVSAANINLMYTQGVVYQLHKHASKGFNTSTGDKILVINDPDIAYTKIPNLNSTDVNKTSDGELIGNKYYSIVLWGVVSEDLKDCQLMLTLPNKSYTNQSDALNDIDDSIDYSIPVEYIGVGYLLTKLVLKNAGGNIEIVEGGIKDLRGLLPSTSSGGGITGGGGVTTYLGLQDTDVSYAGKGLFFPQVSAGETGLEFFDILTPLSEKTSWKGAYVNGAHYLKYQQVTENGYLAIANKDTYDHAAPQESGALQLLIPDTVTFTEAAFTGVVHSGVEVTFTEPGEVRKVELYVPELTSTTHYRAVLINITDPNNAIAEVIQDPLLVEDDWAAVSLRNSIVKVGAKFRLYIDALNSGSDTVVGGDWEYSGTENTAAPATQSWNRRGQDDVLRIDKTDLDSANRTTDLMSIQAGSTIQFTQVGDSRYADIFHVVSDPSDLGTYINFNVLRDAYGISGSVQQGESSTIIATIPIAQSTKYSESVGYWGGAQPSFATAVGYLALDGQVQTTTNAFGLRFDFQALNVSEDWDLQSYSGSATGTSGGDGGTEQLQADWAQSDDTQVDYIKFKPLVFPPSDHIHIINDVTNLQTVLNTKLEGLESGTNISIEPTANPLILKINGPTIPDQAQSDWDVTDVNSPSHILHKPTIIDPIQSNWNQEDVGSLDHVLNRPTTITTEQAEDIELNNAHRGTAHAPADANKNVNADWDSVSGDSEILNKPLDYTPKSHNHPITQVVDLENELAAKELSLNVPENDGDLLSSTIAGARTWITPGTAALPPGGSTGEVLIKQASGNVIWSKKLVTLNAIFTLEDLNNR